MTSRLARIPFSLAFLLCLSCGGGGDPDASPDAPIACGPQDAFEVGDADGHAEPLGAGPGEARAGRVTAAQLPDFPSGLQVWEGGDFVLANDRVAMVIEDVGVSQLYDPWGGRPVGVARVEGGALVEPADFGEILLLMGRMSVMTERVTVLADGSDGGPAVIRAEGVPRPTPFFETIVGPLISGDFSNMRAAIDYELAPGAEHVDVFLELRSEDPRTARALTTMHAFMHTPRMPPFAPGVGFSAEGETVPWLGFVDDDATSFAYRAPGESLGGGFSVSGFVSFFTRPIAAPCGVTRRHHAQVILGGPGAAGLTAAVWRAGGTALQTISGAVTDEAGAAVPGAWVLVDDGADGFVTRGQSGADGRYAIDVPAELTPRVTIFRRGARPVGPAAPGDVTVPTLGEVRVTVTDADDGTALPARVQLIAPDPGEFEVAGLWGLGAPGRGRTHVAYPEDGVVTLPAEAGSWRVVVSRGYEYELIDDPVTVVAGESLEVAAALTRVIDTTDIMCGDFHIHTHRSNDSGDDARLKLRSAVADGVEIPVRTDHEYVADFEPVIAELGLGAFAYGVSSIEMSSFETWGHMGVFPLTARPDELNAGAPRWQRYPTLDEPNQVIENLSPREVFSAVRGRPEGPVIIINHPRGDTNYFGYVGYDPVTGTVSDEASWDEDFALVEVFNDAPWRSSLGGVIRDWLSMLNHGRRVFAVGSSDSHYLSNSPVGYPRTCIEVGTDDPRALTPSAIRDPLVAGRASISGGVYVDARVGEVGSGGDAAGLGERATVAVRVQAASWVDVDRIDVVVDGQIVEMIDIRPADADPLAPTTRFEADLEVPVAPTGSYVIIAAYGDQTLEPVHPGRIPFGVTNPIFLAR